MNDNKKYFADDLLSELFEKEPLVLIYESQYESSKVNFDFKTEELAFERMKDEVRELREAFSELTENSNETEIKNLCDEASDIIFGLVNVLRHSNVEKEKIIAIKNSNIKMPKYSVNESIKEIEKLCNEYKITLGQENNQEMIEISESLYFIREY